MNPRPFACALLLIAASGGSAFAAEAPVEIFAPLPPAESRLAVLPPDAAVTPAVQVPPQWDD